MPFYPISLILAVATAVAVKLLHPVPLSLDAEMGQASIFGVVLAASLFATANWGWGKLLARLSGIASPGPISLALGSLFFCLLAFTAGTLGLIGASAELPAWIIVLIGCGWIAPPKQVRATLSKLSLFQLIFALFAIVFFVRAWMPSFQSDPFFYHISGPWLWAQQGRVQVFPRLPIALEASYWEYLYLWGIRLLSCEPSRGHAEALIFAQITHVLVGYVGCVLTARAILTKLGFSRSSAEIGALAFLGIPFLTFFSYLAKNDFGALFWALAAIQLALIPSRSRIETAWLGVLAGAAFAAKFTTVFLLLPAGVAYLYSCEINRNRRDISIALACAMAGAFPLLVRNWALTANPFFPAADGFFNSPWLSHSLHRVFSFQQQAGGRALLFFNSRISFLTVNQPLFAATILIPLIQKVRIRRITWGSLVAGFILFLVVVAPPIGQDDGTLSVRLAAPLLLPLLALTIAEIYEVSETLIKRKVFRHVVTAVLLVAVLIKAPREWPVLTEGLSNARLIPWAFRTRITGGASMAWLRMNPPATGEWVVTTGSNLLYPVLDLPVVSIRDVPEIDRTPTSLEETASFLEDLENKGLRYILDAPHWEVGYWTGYGVALSIWTRRHPESIVFMSSPEMLVDVHVLLDELAHACRMPVSHPTDWMSPLLLQDITSKTSDPKGA